MSIFTKICNSMENFLTVKNKRYGNSVFEPLGVFSKHIKEGNSQSENLILIRLDDKLSRIKNSEELKENDIVDQIGYLICLCREKGWEDFDHLLD